MDSSSKKVKFLLRVEKDTLDSLRNTAKTRGVSLSQLLRDILNGYVEDIKTVRAPNNPVKKREDQWWL
jgi:hypothetical protein|tara:strand:- start:1063 stop:1266 length:204 start_codon:yes stop_codon:yes gene_type:complete